jgi:hypothetical protein
MLERQLRPAQGFIENALRHPQLQSRDAGSCMSAEPTSAWPVSILRHPIGAADNTWEGRLSRVDGGRANDFDAMSRIVSDAVNDEKSAPQTVIRILPTRPEG